ncbi:MAG: hypothetical protein JXR97_02400 [Planctomycetes bacterium]|nr:hypothetical protein [Planctomycetota bacterium]
MHATGYTSRLTAVVFYIALMAASCAFAAEKGYFENYTLTKPYSKSYSKYLAGGSKGPMSKFYAMCEQVTSLGKRPHAEIKDLLDYNVEKQSTILYIPDNYTDDETWGLLVLIDDIEADAISEEIKEACSKNKVICAWPKKTADLYSDLWRMAITLDTIETVKSNYKIDEKKVVLCGNRNGGGIAIITMMAHRKDFNGVIVTNGGILLKNSVYNRYNLFKKMKRKGYDVNELRPWPAQLGWVKGSDYKKLASEKKSIVFYCSAVPDKEYFVRSAHQWANTGAPFMVIDDPKGAGQISGEWLDKSLRFINDDELIDFAKNMPDTSGYDGVAFDLKKNNSRKKEIKHEEEAKEEKKDEKKEEKK